MSEEFKAPLLGVYGLSYTRQGKKILDEVSFELERGEIVALLGPNGSGKTSLLKFIAGLSLPGTLEGGQARMRGTLLTDLEPGERARQIGYVGADIRAEFPVTAYEAVLMGRACRKTGFWDRKSAEDDAAVRSAMESCLCWELRSRSLESLSGGERQLVAMARALVLGPRLLCLDESLSKMDLHHQAAMGSLLRELVAQGASVLLVAHDVNLASEWASRCLLLKNGKLMADGGVSEVLGGNLRDLYPGAKLVVGQSPASGAVKVFFGKPDR